MNRSKLLTILLFFTSLFYLACEKKDPVIPNEEEVITTFIYTLTPENGGNTVIMSFIDLDGDGGDAPILNAQTLAANQTYNGVLELLNEQVSPAESISEEIKNELEDHQFFFDSAVDGLSITYLDDDSTGNPVGLNTKLTTGNASSGKLKITLRHKLNKSAAGVSNGQIANAGGETDIEVIFDVQVN